MKFPVAIIAATTVVVSAKHSLKNIPEDLSNVEIKAQSKTGNRLLSKARRLDGGGDVTWISGYSLKFQSCSSYQDYYGGYFNGENGANYNYNGNANGNANYNYNYNNQNGQNYNYANGNYNGQNRNDFQGMYQQQLVQFKLCPSDSCFRCKNGAEYVVQLKDFVDAVLEAKMNAQEYQCEMVRENCYCENANYKESCQYDCFKNAGLEDCAKAMEEQEFDLQEATECVQLEIDEEAAKNYYFNNRQANQVQNYYAQNGQYNQNGDGNGNGNGNMRQIEKLFVGPYCSKNGNKILLGTFMEETCSYPAPDGIYEALNYGDSLPYSKKSIVDTSCISCKEPKDVNYNNYWDQQDSDEVTEVCENLYEMAGKCEEGLDGYFPYRDVSGCGFIKSLKSTGISMPSANIPAKVFAGIFAATTALLAGVSVALYKKNSRQNVSLAGDAIIS